MPTKTHLNRKIIIAGMFAGLLYAAAVFAVSTSNITFPIPELGNCQNKDACREYCNNPDNVPACQSFAETHGLAPKKDSNDHGVNKLAEAIKNGGGPGGCADIESCRSYCQNPDNRTECTVFAQVNGLTPPNKPNDEGGKIQKLIRDGKKPPGNCTSQADCQQFCSTPDHQKECLSFARENGLISQEESDKANKFVSLVQAGQTPGDCKTRDECHQYCSQPEHASECADFMLKLGVVTQDQADSFKETKGKGPEGCQSKEECAAFCNDPTNQEVCLKFAQEHNIISKDKVQDIKSNTEQIKNKLNGLPPGVLSCLREKIGADIVEKIANGQLLPSSNITALGKVCFDRHNDENKNSENHPSVSPTSRPPIPPQILACLKEHLSESDYQNFAGDHPVTQNLTPGVIEIFKRCAQNLQTQNHEGQNQQGEIRKCLPRPACLDATPRCMIPEPASGWCPRTSDEPRASGEQRVQESPAACPAGSLWNGRECLNMAAQCHSLGGQWNADNFTCLRPSSSLPPRPEPKFEPEHRSSSMMITNRLTASIFRFLLGRP